jgi:hypothetical protein
MSDALVQITPAPSVADLEREGFTPEQIARLEALRDRYPATEYCESDQQLRRLELMRWLYQNGRLTEQTRRRRPRRAAQG